MCHDGFEGPTCYDRKKKLALDLQLTTNNLVLCPFTIVTSISHMERTTGYTREPLDPTAIGVYFARLPHDVTLMNEAYLRHLGQMDMKIKRWPCLGHTRIRAGQGLKDPMSSLF